MTTEKTLKERLLLTVQAVYITAKTNETANLPDKNPGTDKKRIEIINSFNDDNIVLMKLIEIGKKVKPEIIKHEFGENSQLFLKRFIEFTEPGYKETSTEVLKKGKEKEQVKQLKDIIWQDDFLVCTKCKKKTVFTKDVISGMVVSEPTPLTCNNCGKIAAIIKDQKSKLKSYNVKYISSKDENEQTLKGIEAINYDHLLEILDNKGIKDEDILEVGVISGNKMKIEDNVSADELLNDEDNNKSSDDLLD